MPRHHNLDTVEINLLSCMPGVSIVIKELQLNGKGVSEDVAMQQLEALDKVCYCHCCYNSGLNLI
jgi:hypothetical protein